MGTAQGQVDRADGSATRRSAGSPAAAGYVSGLELARLRWGTWLLAALIAVVFLLHLQAWRFLCDDAFISFRYARNLGEHGALVYNLAPLERVEGYTNFLWVLTLAAGVVVGLAPEQLAPVLTAGAGLASLWLIASIVAALRRDGHGPTAALHPLDMLAPGLLVLVPEFVVWGSSGLETGVALALGLGAIRAWLGERLELAALLAGLAGLTRPDALLWIAAFGLGWLAVTAIARRSEKKPLTAG
ncbi:MAG: hypothetical protein KC431_15465, partial [Myxococcales bacterium]|nr:hypothetical protein [Myxococcales bacterium]